MLTYVESEWQLSRGLRLMIFRLLFEAQHCSVARFSARKHALALL